jgi:hypothetical protein
MFIRVAHFCFTVKDLILMKIWLFTPSPLATTVSVYVSPFYTV